MACSLGNYYIYNMKFEYVELNLNIWNETEAYYIVILVL